MRLGESSVGEGEEAEAIWEMSLAVYGQVVC